MFAVPFTKAARARKADKAVLGASRVFLLSYEDLPEYNGSAGGTEKSAAFAKLRGALAAKDAAACRELLEFLDPPKSFALGREWLDVLVVALSVAMAFRTYFYQPFNIPTGSMQPTLYGNHSVTCAPSQADAWDKGPLRWLKWLATGRIFRSYSAPFDGTLVFRPTDMGRYDMRVVNAAHGIQSKSMPVPTDVLRGNGGDAPVAGEIPKLPNGLRPGSPVYKGQHLWSGYDVTGDFLFVNRWIWNFRHPRRGDVMVFSTTGIKDLAQGTYYIKRMTGLPGETLSIKGGSLYIDGKRPAEPRRIAQIQNRERGAPHMYPYAGYRPSGDVRYSMPGKTIAGDGDTVRLGADEFYACGDNSPSSYDSRFWGPVPARNLCGMAGGVFWPFFNSRWGNIE